MNLGKIIKKTFHQYLISYRGMSKYNKIPTHMTEEEKLLLYRLSRKLKPGNKMIEIGSYLGASSCFLASGGYKDSIILYCVDTWENDAMSEGQRNTYEEFLLNTQDYKQQIKPLRGHSIQVAKKFQEKIDLLFIDGDHSYDGCYNDWKHWCLFLNENSIVIFHDVAWAEGVQKVIRENVTPRAITEQRIKNIYWAWV